MRITNATLNSASSFGVIVRSIIGTWIFSCMERCQKFCQITRHCFINHRWTWARGEAPGYSVGSFPVVYQLTSWQTAGSWWGCPVISCNGWWNWWSTSSTTLRTMDWRHFTGNCSALSVCLFLSNSLGRSSTRCDYKTSFAKLIIHPVNNMSNDHKELLRPFQHWIRTATAITLPLVYIVVFVRQCDGLEIAVL